MLALNSKRTGVRAGVLPALWCLIWICLAPGSSAAAGMKDSLRGLTSLYVSIEGITPAVQASGLSQERVRTDAEKSLREAGIQVLSEQEWQKTPDRPILSIQLRTYRYPGIKEEDGALCAYSVDVRFFQGVSLLRQPAVKVGSPTWSSESTLGITPEKNLGLIRDYISQFVGQFINDYTSVNPKPGPGTEKK